MTSQKRQTTAAVKAGKVYYNVSLNVSLVAEKEREQCPVHLQAAVVMDKAHFTEPVHKITHSGSRGANHFCQCFLAHLQDGRLRLGLQSEVHQR